MVNSRRPSGWRVLPAEKIDLVHPLFPDSLYFGTIVAKLAGVPCVAGFQVSLGYLDDRRATAGSADG